MDTQLQGLSYFLQSVRQGLNEPRSQQDFARLDRIYHELLDLLPEYRAQLLQYFRNSDPNSQILPELESEFLTSAINIIEQKQAESQQGVSIPPNLSKLVDQQRQAQVQRTRTRTQVEQAVRAFENQLQQPLDPNRRQEIAARAAASIDDLTQQDPTQIASTITTAIQTSGAFNLEELNARGQRYTGELIYHLANEIQTASTTIQSQSQAPSPVSQLPDNPAAYQPDPTTTYGPFTRTETLTQIQQELQTLQATEQSTPTYQQLQDTRRQYEEISTQLQQATPPQTSTSESTNPWADRIKFGIAENYSPRGYVLGNPEASDRNDDLQSALLISRTINQLELQPRDYTERKEYSRVTTVPLASLPESEFKTIQAQNPQISRDDILVVQSYASNSIDQSGRNGSFRSFAVMSRNDADKFVATVQQDPTQFTQLLHATNGGQPTTRWDGQPLDIRPGRTVTIVPNTAVGGSIASEIRPEVTYPENYKANATPQVESQTRQQRYQELQETQTRLAQQLQSAQAAHDSAPEVQELRTRSEELRTEQQRIRDIPLSAYTPTPPSPQTVNSNEDLPRSTVPIIPTTAQEAYNQAIFSQSAQLAQSVVASVQGSIALEQLAAQKLQTNLQNRFDALLRNGVPESRAVSMITNELEVLGISPSQALDLARAQSESYRSSLAATQTSYIITGESSTPGSITAATNQVRARALAEEVLGEIETQQKQPIPPSRRDQLTDALTTELEAQLNSGSDPLDLRIATTSTLIANQISPDLANNVTTARGQSFETAVSFRDSTLAASQAFQQVSTGTQDAATAIDQLRAQAATNPVLRDHLPFYEQALQEVVPTTTTPMPASLIAEPRGRLGISDTTIAAISVAASIVPESQRVAFSNALAETYEQIHSDERNNRISPTEAGQLRNAALIRTFRQFDVQPDASTLNAVGIAIVKSAPSQADTGRNDYATGWAAPAPNNPADIALSARVASLAPAGATRNALYENINSQLIDVHNQELRGIITPEEATERRRQVISRSLSTVGITASQELLDQATNARATASSFQTGPQQREIAARLATAVIGALSPTSDVFATQINALQNQLETAFQINLTAQATPAQLQQVATNIVGRQNISTTTGTPDLSTVDFQAATSEAAAARYANNILARVASGELNAEGARTLLRQEARANPTLAANLTVIENDLQTVYADRTDSLRDTRTQDRFIEREVEKRLRAEGLLADNQDYQTSKSSIERYQEIAEAKTTDGISKLLEASGRKFNSEAERVQTILEIKDSLMQEAYATRDNTDLQGTLTRAITAQLQKQGSTNSLAYKSGITPETATAAEALAAQLATDSSFKMALNLHSQIDQAKAASLEAEYVKGGPATRQRQALVAAAQAVAVGASITENQRVTMQRNLESDLASINRQIADGTITATQGQQQVTRAVVRNLQAAGLDAQRAEDLGSQAATFANRIATQTQNQQLTPTLSQIKDISAALSAASTVANSAKVTTDRDAFLTQVNSSLQQIQEDYSQGRISAQTAQRQISHTLQSQLEYAGLEQDEAKKLVQKAQRHAETATAPALPKELNPTLAAQVGLLVQTGLAVGQNTQDRNDISLKTAKDIGLKIPKNSELETKDIQNLAKITAISNNVSDYIATQKGLDEGEKSKLQGDLRRTITDLIKSGADGQTINQAVQELLADKYGTAVQGIPPSRFGIADAEHADPASRFTGEAYAEHIKASQTEKDLAVLLEQILPGLSENDRKLLAQELTGAAFGEVVVVTDKDGKERVLIGQGLLNSKAFDLTIAEKDQLARLAPIRANFTDEDEFKAALFAYNQKLNDIFEAKKEAYLDTLSAGFSDYLREAAAKKGIKLGKNIRIGDLYEAGYLAALLSPEVIGETNAEYRELHGKNFDPKEVVSLEEAVKRLLRERVQNLNVYIDTIAQLQKNSVFRANLKAADYAQYSNFLSNGIDFITDIASTNYAERRINELVRLPIDKLFDISMRLAGINKEYAATYYLHATINGSLGTAKNILGSDIAKFQDRYGRYLRYSVTDLISSDSPLPDNIPAYLRAQIRGFRKRQRAIESYEKSMPQWAQKLLESRAIRRKRLSNKIGQEFMDQVIMRGDVGGFLINSLAKRGALYFINKILEGTGYFTPDPHTKSMVFIPLEQAKENARQKFYELRDKTISFVWNTKPIKALREFTSKSLSKSSKLLEKGATKLIGKAGVKLVKKGVALLTTLVLGLIPTGITQLIAAYAATKALIGAIPVLGWIIMYFWNRLERLVLTVVKVLFALLMWTIWQTLGWVFSAALAVIGAVGGVINFFQNLGTTIGNGWGVLTSGIGGFFSGLGAGISGALSGAGAALASTAGAVASAGSILAGLTASVPSAFLGFLSSLGPLGLPALGVLTIGPYAAMLNIAALTEAFNNSPGTLAGDAQEIDLLSNPLQIEKIADNTSASINQSIRYTIRVNVPACDSPLIIEDKIPAGSIFSGFAGNSPIAPPVSSINASGPDADGNLLWTITIDNPQGPCTESSGFTGGVLNFRAPNDTTTRNAIEQLINNTPNRYLSDSIDFLISYGTTKNVNALAAVAIMIAESQLGEEDPQTGTGPGTGIGAPPERGGCYNPWGAVDLHTNIPELSLCRNINGVAFTRFNSYEQSLTYLINTINNRLNDLQNGFEGPDGVVRNVPPNSSYTVEYFSAMYIPANVHSNCRDWEPGYVGSRFGCINGHNANWKRTVAGILSTGQRNHNLRNINTYISFRGPLPGPTDLATPTPSNNNVNLELYYDIVVDPNITNSNGELQRGCIVNIVQARIGTSPNVLTGQARETVSVGGEVCSVGSDQYCTTNPSTLSSEEIISGLREGKIYMERGSGDAAPNRFFNKPELEAVWRLACRINQSDTFMNMLMANNTGIEIQKTACNYGPSSFPSCPSPAQHRAYWKGVHPRAVNLGAQLILITNKMDTANTQLFIHLVAHELGHIAQYAGGNPNSMPAYQQYLSVFNYDKPISNYACSYRPSGSELTAIENHSELIGFYTTNGENNSQYFGRSRNFQSDTTFNANGTSCSLGTYSMLEREYYNVIKEYFFDDIEFDNNDL